MWKCVVFVVLCTFAILVQSEDGYRDVQIAQGTVRGHYEPLNKLYVFFNIPYATAPTGPNRYKAPLPPPVFLSTFDAVDRRIICPQPPWGFNDGTNAENMREDCLVTNVFVPETATPNTKLPVLVIVHGGAYQYGSGRHENFRELANTKSKPVIVVTFNYRLGVHGFLCLGTEGAPGNAGLKDQVALLRWVNTNIASFGGNPDDVTLAACSAGSGSIDFLTLSPITKGLFKKAIMESGVSTGGVGVQIDPIENAKYYAKLLAFSDVNDLTKLEEFYRNASFQTIMSRHEVITNNQNVTIRFSPCVERDIGQERVLSDAPFNILKEGDYSEIPLIYGFTNKDGAMRLSSFPSWSQQMNEKFSDFLPAELYFENDDIKEEVAQQVKQHYFGNEDVSWNNIEKYIQYMTDVLFGVSMLRSLSTRVRARNDSIYLFEYSFVDDNTLVIPGTDIKLGAGHCHQITAVMDQNVTGTTIEYQRMKATMREYWHNFIWTGSPTTDSDPLQWKPAGSGGYPHMSLGPSIQLKNENILGDRMPLWDSIYDEYYRGPAPLPPPVFLSTFDAIDRRIICPQPSWGFNTSSNAENMREDCLVTNVFVPETATPNTKLPVLVIVHGGAYQYGSGRHENFRELANTKSKPVIVVTFNYRLGVHGFLCLGTEGAPGNAGLKDQVALLRWVNTNIASFGGNPDDVTLAGCSAGSGSIDFLTLSPITKGLFKKAIMESGVSTGGVGVQIDPIENAKYYATVLAFNDVDDLTKLEEFYRNASFQTIMSRHEVITSNQNVTMRFSPCVERDIGQERVLSDAPLNILKEGYYTEIPLMYGFTNKDGVTTLHSFPSWSQRMNEKFSDFLPAELYFENDDIKEEVAQKVKQHYFGNEDVSWNNIEKYLQYMTDVLFGVSMLRSLSTRVRARNDTIYLFEYSFVDDNTAVIPGTDIKLGAGHCHQITAVMDQNVTGTTIEYQRMKATMREYWHNFIWTGSPTTDSDPLQWKPAGSGGYPHMSLGPSIQLKNENILGDRMPLWDSIYDEYYRGPYNTTTPETTTDPTTTTPVTTSDPTNTTTATTPDPGSSGAKAPLPPPVFLSTFDAVDRRIICPQPSWGFNTSSNAENMREDCLVTNVFVPETATPNTKLPVLVIVHGGAYQYGSGRHENFRELANTKSKPVIVVTFNYRLGVHGFLCLGTEGAPGNAGLKDQVALLRWVNTNIASFGGNPDDVTLAGCSAGSGSIDFLTLSPITKGLFKKAIMESGVSTGGVGVQIDPIENAKYYATVLAFNDVDDLTKLEEFYRNASFQTIMSRHEVITSNQNVTIRFSPCVERDIGQERVLSDAPLNILKEGDYTEIPLMYGFTNKDGVTTLHSFPSWNQRMNEKFSDFLPAELYFENDDIKEEVAQKVKQHYFGNEDVSWNNIEKYLQYMTDVLFGVSMLRSLSTRVRARNDTIYLFEYSFVDDNTAVIPGTDIKLGAGHCHQITAVMDQNVTGTTIEYQRMKATMREYWHNFIWTGSPATDSDPLQWKPAGSGGYPHMSLGPSIQLKNENILGDRMPLWDSIYDEYYRGPYNTTTPETTTDPTTTTPVTTSDPTNTTTATTPDPGSSGAKVISNVMAFIVSSCLVEMFQSVVFVLCTFAILVQSEDGYQDVQIAQGTVRGHLDPVNKLYVFYNIPYATAPTGPDRFKAPRPPPVFLSTFDAVDRRIICPQPSWSNMNILEDCLVANVFVPATATSGTNLPVLVVVHGGAYQYGNGAQEKFSEFASTESKPVIVVTFNYRLGVHGFLCLGTEDAPGNAGLKDQVALLRWVNTNIASFGGNPDDVTLAACSAGSGAVDFLTLSPVTKGLFKKAIMESGVSTGGVGVQIDPIENAKYYAKVLAFSDVDDLTKLEEFYKTASFQTLISQTDAITNNENAALQFGPCVESDIGQERVVIDAPFRILEEANYTEIPLMYGFTNMDGAMRLSFFDSWSKRMNENFTDFLPAELYFGSEDIKEKVAQNVKQHYFGTDDVSRQKFIKYYTDVLFGYPMLRSLSTRIKAREDTIYLFEYSFVDDKTPVIPETDIKMGAGHCHQIEAVKDEDLTGKTVEYQKMKETMREYWHNFILTSSPTSDSDSLQWEPAGPDGYPHMSLGIDIQLKNEDILGVRKTFWDSIYEEYYRGPVMPETSTTTPDASSDPTTEDSTTSDISTTTTTDSSITTSTTPTDSPTTDSTTPDPGSGGVKVISNIMFVLVSFSFYYALH
ncbi:hypothetical protein PYW07_014441 [Mythimna separata]|uniref:Carboxylesterase type B domain-containing protein n=1 Tax=Mythimna separata TaxID=271217 RepID=A0AAD7YZS4_MYTSE|nr:hypothetical protein PYW07_014441 [Mythimna separata]